MTSLLPKSSVDFSEADYWEAFFKQRGNDAFEWYGEYAELCGHLHKYIKPKDNILVVGCGNSKLSEGLYDVGYRQITNIDISKVAIRQMKTANEERRPELIFEEMDAMHMTYDSDSFTVVFDKGTFDALMPNKEKETVAKVTKYLEEIDRVLRIGGRYIVITLLQEHIMTFLLEYFAERAWMIRVCRCHEAEERSNQELNIKSLPVFMVIFTKFKKMSSMKSVCELCLYTPDSLARVEGIEKIKEAVIEAQKVSMVVSGLQRSTTEGKEMGFEVSRPNEDTPRYCLRIVEKANARKKGMNYAAFVVPQGRECEWIFGTPEGRQFLLSESKMDRLAVIILNRGHTFSGLEEVKGELSPLVQDFKPADFCKQILYLSVGGDLGIRNEVCSGESRISGKYIVEETQPEKGYLLRRLYFLSNKSAIQSEAKVRRVKTRKGGERVVVDTTSLSCSYHGYMTIGASTVLDGHTEGNVLVIGLGGGGLCSFMRKTFPKSVITAIELDLEVLNIAVDYFGLIQDKQLIVYLKDGLVFLREAEERGYNYDVVVFDVDSKDVISGLSSPSKEFIELVVLQRVKKLLKPKGLFILNLVCRKKCVRDDLNKQLKEIYGTVKPLKLDDDLNELFFCWKHTKIDPATALVSGYSKLNDVIKQKKLDKLPCVDVSCLTGLLVD